jgi:hypothetical protein
VSDQEQSLHFANVGPPIAVRIRSQRVFREVPLPQSWREQVHVLGRVGVDSLKDADQKDVGIDSLHPTNVEQALDDPDVLGVRRGPDQLRHHL